VKGITARVMKAGMASPAYFQLMSLAAEAIMAPTMISVQPVAQGGMEAKIGAKKIEMKKQTPVVMAVRPVLPPSEIPAPDSMKAVTGERPKRDPIEMERAVVMLVKLDDRQEWMITHHQQYRQLQSPRNLE
jgi:glutamate 5-kinase